MTDDEILAAAKRIQARRLNAQRLASFLTRPTVMIRWDNAGVNFGESYTGIEVDAALVRAIVEDHFAPLVAQ